MATWRINHERIGASGITDTSTTQLHNLGYRIRAYDATLGDCEFVYVKGVASGAAGLLATYTASAGVTVLTVARTKGLCGVMMAALSATTIFGWLQVCGLAEVQVAGTVVAGATVYTTATAGKVDDAVTAGDIVYNANFQTADGTPIANWARVSLANPFVGDTDNA